MTNSGFICLWLELGGPTEGLLLAMIFRFTRAVLLGGKRFASVLCSKRVAASVFTHGFLLWLSIPPTHTHT